MNEKIKVTVAERTFLLTSSDEESYVQKVAESVDEQIRQAAEASTLPPWTPPSCAP